MTKNMEILSPAGSYESLKAAIAAGADAVYIGGSKFGARAYADNLDEKTMLEAIDYVHLHDRKIYLTINTLLKETELKNELYHYLLPYYRQGVDAVIVQDIGVLMFIRKHFPDLPIHASTQMTITDRLGAEFLEKLGVERVVTAREMQLEEIKEISKHTNLEIESFVHGALCYCYSGQCLYSSMIGGRSGNRGQCAQPCRLPYKVSGQKKSQYILSLKDICTLDYIPELVEAGITSFKIEGRMKKPEYVALVTAMYRKYLDLYLKEGKEAYQVDSKDKEKLMDLYNRGGFHDGYYRMRNGKEMISLDRPNHAGVPALQVIDYHGKTVTAKALTEIHAKDVIELTDGKENFTFANDIKKGQSCSFSTHKKQLLKVGDILSRIRNEQLISEIQDFVINQKPKEKINGKLILNRGTLSQLIISYHDFTVTVTGDMPQDAMNQPIDAARVERQMRKTGNTEYEFECFDIELEDGLFLSMQKLNELRRDGIEALEQKVIEKYRRCGEKALDYSEIKAVENRQTDCFYAYVEDVQQLEVLLQRPSVKRLYVDANAIEHLWDNNVTKEIVQAVRDAGKEIYLAMPHVFRERTRQRYEQNYSFIFDAGWDGILIRNYESYEFLQQQGYNRNIVTDSNLYQFNHCAKSFWKKEGVEATTAPLELNYNELKELGLENSELVVYGYYPMMVSAQCVAKTTGDCKKQKEKLTFKDRYHKEFSVKNHCDYCYNVIYNTNPVILADRKSEILNLSPKALRLHFTIEKPGEVETIMELYEKAFSTDGVYEALNMEFTRGHFKRGIK